jgi:hypothetical protein
MLVALLPLVVGGVLAYCLFPLPVGTILILIGWSLIHYFLLLIHYFLLRRPMRHFLHVRHFRTEARGKIVLHYDPPIVRCWSIAVFMDRCETELDRLTKQFGFSLLGRVHIFLFRDIASMSRIHGSQVGGFAVAEMGSIFLVDGFFTPEHLRHELGHLFAARWNNHAPPLFCEGLAVWLQQTIQGIPLATAARPWLGQSGLKLQAMFSPKFFYAEPQRAACYILAGSFTEFLIRRHGWERYRWFYQRSNSQLYRSKFKRCFGVTLEKAEWQWRNELILMDIFNRRLGRGACS